MKNNIEDINLSKLKWWNQDIGFLIKEFNSIFKELEMVLSETSSQYTRFKSKSCDIVFQYDVNRYGTGRTMVDIFIEKEDELKRLSQILYEDKSLKNLNKQIRDATKEQTPPIRVFEKLFREHLYEYVPKK